MEIENNKELQMKKLTFKKIAVGIFILILVSLTVFFVKKMFDKPKYERASLVKTELYVDPPLEAQGKIVSQLPYTGEGFTVEYVPTSGFYLFRFQGSKVELVIQARDKAFAWIQSHSGLEGTKFCGLKYQFIHQFVENDENQKMIGETFPSCNYTNPGNIN